MTCSHSRGWPHHHVGTDGSASSSPSRCRHSPGRKGSSAGVSSTPLPSALATATWPARTAWTSPATPSDESPRSSSGSQKSSSMRRRMTSTGCRPSTVFRKTRLVAHGEVAALDEREAEIAREIGVLEVGLVVGARREQHDARRVGRPRRQRVEHLAQAAEERRQPLHAAVAEGLRQAARQRDPVLERVAGAGRRLGAIGEHPPRAVGRAREVGGVAGAGAGRRVTGRP